MRCSIETQLWLGVSLAFGLGGAATGADTIAGTWAYVSQKSTGLGGCLLIFADGGSVTNITGVVGDDKYRADGQTLTTTFTIDRDSGKTVEKSEPYEIIGDKLIKSPNDATNRLEMTRIGAAKPGAPAIVGLWTYEWNKKPDKHGRTLGIMATIQYGSDGRAQFILPMLTNNGRFKLQSNELTMELEGQPPERRKILVSGDDLTLLADGVERERKFTRVLSP
jgi:hypothetical protein